MILERLQPQPPTPSERDVPIKGFFSENPKPSHTPYLLSALVLVFIAGSIARGIGHAPPVPLIQSFDNFPSQIGSWEGKAEKIDPAVIDILKTNEYVDMNFTGPDGKVSVWIAYYRSQPRGTFLHSPLTCLKGSGWKFLETGKIDFAPSMPINYMIIEQGGSRQMVFYWYFLGGRWLTYEKDYLSKFYQGYDGLVRRRTDGALIRLITPVGQDFESSRERLLSFSRLLIPVLHRFMDLND